MRIIVIIGRLLLMIHFGENESSFLGICGFFEGVFRGYLINTRSTYGCNFYTLRYWRSKDTAWMTDHWYNQSCLELLVYNNRLFIGIWFGKNNKELMKLKSHDHDIIEKSNEYSGYTWVDENEMPAPANENLIKWLCESGHETAFRKELSNCNRDVVISEMKHLKEYLDILLNRN